MAVAMIYPEHERGRGKKGPAKEIVSISFIWTKQARFILRCAPARPGRCLYDANAFA